MPEILLSQPTATELNHERAREEAERQLAARRSEQITILRTQLAGTVMGALMQTQYADHLKREAELHEAANRRYRADKNHGKRINGEPQRPVLPIDVGRPALVAVGAADALLQALGLVERTEDANG